MKLILDTLEAARLDLTDAARAIVYQRDYHAERGTYDPTTYAPGVDQCFDDWAADILEACLARV